MLMCIPLTDCIKINNEYAVTDVAVILQVIIMYFVWRAARITLWLLVPAMVRILSAQASQVFGSMSRGAQWSAKVKLGLL